MDGAGFPISHYNTCHPRSVHILIIPQIERTDRLNSSFYDLMTVEVVSYQRYTVILYYYFLFLYCIYVLYLIILCCSVD